MIVIDMELPKTCRSCNLSLDAYGSITEGKCAALRCGVTYMNDRRNPICPIIGEIPDKHGALIDRDKLLLEMVVINSLDDEAKDLFLEAVQKSPVILEASE